MQKLFANPTLLVLLTGLSCLLIGLLYIPVFPWYILGDVKEAEIGTWGICSVTGGALCTAGAALLAMTSPAFRKPLLLIGLLGMLTILLAQVPAIMMWLFYGGHLIAAWLPIPLVGGWLGLSLHILLAASSILTFAAIGRALVAPASPTRLTAKQWGSFAAVLGALAASLLLWNTFEQKNWIASTSPVDGALHVPLHSTVSVQFAGEYKNNLGLRIRYADDPHTSIPGETGASKRGMSFTPEKPFLPGKKLIVTVEAGIRTHRFSFETATE